MEIDLSKPLTLGAMVVIEGEEEAKLWQDFVYENIGEFYFSCGKVGHQHLIVIFLRSSQSQ